MSTRTVLILGTLDREDPAKVRLLEALTEAAKAHAFVLNTRWITPKELALYPGLVTEAEGVVLAPTPFSTPPLIDEEFLQAISLARRFERPFLATGESAHLLAIELGRNVLGMRDAGIPLQDRRVHDPVVLAAGEDPSRAGPAQPGVEWIAVRTLAGVRQEAFQNRYVLNPDYAEALEEAGLEVVARTADQGRPVAHRLAGQRAFLAITYNPELGEGAQHPLLATFIEAVAAPRS